MKTFFAFVPAAVWALAVLVLSAMSGLNPPPIRLGVIGPDKFAHFGVYALLALLLWFGLYRTGRQATAGLWIFLGCSLYGGAIEIMQFAFFPHRSFEFWDILANICGTAAGWLVGYLYSK